MLINTEDLLSSDSFEKRKIDRTHGFGYIPCSTTKPLPFLRCRHILVGMSRLRALFVWVALEDVVEGRVGVYETL